VPGPPGCGLDARLTTLLCKKMLLLRNPKKVKTGCNKAEIFYGMLWLKKGCFANDDINQPIFVMETQYVFCEE
jgi:hypothetical protein